MPGSRLDVLATYRSDKSPEPVTVTVLQNADVLAVGHQMQPDPDGKPTSVTVVTLLLTPEDTEKAVMASTQGTIHFVMRSGSDSHVSNNAPVQLSALTSNTFAVPRPQPSVARRAGTPARAPQPEMPQLFTVQTILGDKVVTNTFQVGTP